MKKYFLMILAVALMILCLGCAGTGTIIKTKNYIEIPVFEQSYPLEKGVEFKLKLRVYNKFDGYPLDAGSRYQKWGTNGSTTTSYGEIGTANGKFLEITVWFTNKEDNDAVVYWIRNPSANSTSGNEFMCSLQYGNNQTAVLKGFSIPGTVVANYRATLFTSYKGVLNFNLKPKEETWILMLFDVPDDVSEFTFTLKDSEPVTVKIPI